MRASLARFSRLLVLRGWIYRKIGYLAISCTLGQCLESKTPNCLILYCSSDTHLLFKRLSKIIVNCTDRIPWLKSFRKIVFFFFFLHNGDLFLEQKISIMIIILYNITSVLHYTITLYNIITILRFSHFFFTSFHFPFNLLASKRQSTCQDEK